MGKFSFFFLSIVKEADKVSWFSKKRRGERDALGQRLDGLAVGTRSASGWFFLSSRYCSIDVVEYFSIRYILLYFISIPALGNSRIGKAAATTPWKCHALLFFCLVSVQLTGLLKTESLALQSKRRRLKTRCIRLIIKTTHFIYLILGHIFRIQLQKERLLHMMGLMWT